MQHLEERLTKPLHVLAAVSLIDRQRQQSMGERSF
jgi:hypothetical protein